MVNGGPQFLGLVGFGICGGIFSLGFRISKLGWKSTSRFSRRIAIEVGDSFIKW